MTGQVAQSLLVHFVGQVVGFRSIIPACNGGALTSKPPHTGVHTLRRAPAAALLPDHAAGTGIAPEIASGRGCAVVRFREVNIQPALCRGNGVAGPLAMTIWTWLPFPESMMSLRQQMPVSTGLEVFAGILTAPPPLILTLLGCPSCICAAGASRNMSGPRWVMANTWTNVSREDAGFSLTLISLSPVQFMCSKMVSGPVRLATCAFVGIAVSVMATSAAARMGTAVKTLMGV